MQSNLSMVKLGTILIQNGENEQVEADKSYKLLGVRLEGNGAFLREEKMGTQIAATYLKKVRSGDFIYSRLFAWKGAFGLISDGLDGAYVSNEFPIFRIDTTKIVPRYLEFYFNQKSIWVKVEKYCMGTTKASRNRFKENFFLDFVIPLPSIKKQQLIVATLEQLMAKIGEARKGQAKIDEENQELWRHASRKILKDFPADYWRQLSEVIDIQGGATPSKNNPAFFNGNIPWIRPQNMKTIEIFQSSDYVSQSAIDNSALNIFQPGSVLIVIRGMILVHTVPSAILRVPATVNQDMKVLIPHQEILPEYLCTVFWGLNKELLQLVEKSGHDTRRLPTPNLLKFKIPVPPLPEQRRIVAHLDRLQAKVDEVKRLQAETEREMEALVSAVLAKAFS